MKLIFPMILVALCIVQPGAQARLGDEERAWLAARQDMVFAGQESYRHTDDLPSSPNLVADGGADALIGDKQIVPYHLYSSELVDPIKKAAEPLLVALTVLIAVALTSLAWTRRLNRVVLKKTAELRDLNQELKDSNDRLTKDNAQLIMDMEERARMEEERRRLEARMIKAQNYESLSLLAGGVAQEFNNQLTAIIGNIDAALDGTSPHLESRQHLSDAIDTARQAGVLAKRLLDFSGRTVAAREPVNLVNLLGSMTKVLEAATPHGIPLEFHLDGQAVMVRGDPVQLRQVIVNLVLNAAESYESSGSLPHTEKCIRIRVGIQDLDPALAASIRAGQELSPGRYAFMEVVDTGEGIERESMNRLFDPFYSTRKNGRGLGLAALAGIVQVHTGAIAVQSVPGIRTTFTVLLPLDAGSVTPKAGPVAVPAGLRLKGTVLLVEDEDGVRKTTARMLESLGLQVIQAKNSAIAASILRKNRDTIQGILLDLTIGSQDSKANFLLAQELAAGVPIILTTGYSDAELKGMSSTGDLAGVLEKPYDRPMLEGAILSCFPELSKAQA